MKRILILAGLSLLVSCGIRAVGSGSLWTEVPPSPPVPADGVLEAVTWNLKWFGDGTFGTGGNNGPADEQLQARNIVRVLDSLDADLYAFQEVYSSKALRTLTAPMEGYSGFVAGHISWIQKTAFMYNTAAIDSLSAGAITAGLNKADWANGRYPLYFKFNYRWKDTSLTVLAIVIHAKAFADRESYFKRKRAARQLHRYLQENEPQTPVLLLGDFNDDVDRSIYARAPTPYADFTTDTTQFNVVTAGLSRAGLSSTSGHGQVIDHIIISDELFPFYLRGSEAVYREPAGYINRYTATTSDHFPVWAKFSIKKEGF